jgi:hypothetical protein
MFPATGTHQQMLVFERRQRGSQLIRDNQIEVPPIGILQQVINWLHALGTA